MTVVKRKLDVEKIFSAFVTDLSDAYPSEINAMQRQQLLSFTRNEVLNAVRHGIRGRKVKDIDFASVNKIYADHENSRASIRSYLKLFQRFCSENPIEVDSAPNITLDELSAKYMPALTSAFDKNFMAVINESVPMLTLALPTIMNFDFSGIDVDAIEPKDGEELTDSIRRFVNSPEFDKVAGIFMEKFKVLSSMIPALTSASSLSNLSSSPLINSKLINDLSANFKLPVKK
jgi:hypothetical protein